MYRYPLNCIDTEALEQREITLVQAPTTIFLHQMFPTARIIIKAINKPLQHLQQEEEPRDYA